MFLKRLELTNVRCFRSLAVDFAAPAGGVRKWTVVLGENGMGKSTILRAAALATCGSDSLAEVLGEPSSWLMNGTDRCEIKALVETKAKERHQLSIEIRSGDGVSDILTRAGETLKPLNEALKHTNRNYFVAGYGASRRLANPDSGWSKTSPFRNIRAQSIATLFDRDATLNPLESWAVDLDYRGVSGGIATVRNVLSAFLPNMRFHSIDRDKKHIIFKTRDGLVPLQHLSDGYQNVAAWVGDLLFRINQAFGDYKTPLAARGLLIIDELDLHLHPLWQRSVHSFLSRKLPNMQILATTHSAVTAQQADANELHFLKRERGRIKLWSYEDDPSKLLINQLLMSEVFGLQSDEALSVEERKDEYRALRDKASLSESERGRLNMLRSDFAAQPVQRREATLLAQDQIALLKQVQAELSRGK